MEEFSLNGTSRELEAFEVNIINAVLSFACNGLQGFISLKFIKRKNG
jgi:hypothetical protein